MACTVSQSAFHSFFSFFYFFFCPLSCRVFVVAGFYTGVVDLQNLTVYEASKNHLEPIANLPTSFYAYASAGFTTTIDPTSNTVSR